MKAKFIGKIQTSDQVWNDYVNIEMHKPKWEIVHKEQEFWIANYIQCNNSYVIPKNFNSLLVYHGYHFDFKFIIEQNVYIEKDITKFDMLKPWPHIYFIAHPNYWQEISESSMIQSGCYCSKCKEYFPYANYEENFKCWKCKNGF